MPQQDFDNQPIETDDRIVEISDILTSHRLFSEGIGRASRTMIRIGAILVLVALISLPVIWLADALIGGIDNAIAIGLAITVGLVILCGLATIVVASRKPAMSSAFLLDGMGNLWCITSESKIGSVEVDRKILLSAREKVAGPSRDLTNGEARHLLFLTSLVEEASMGNTADGYDVDLIEDIEDIAGEDGRLIITYTDRLNGDRKELGLDPDRWGTFLAWLDARHREDTGSVD